MPIVTDGPMMAPERGIDELHASGGQAIGAAAAEAWADSPLQQLSTIGEIEGAKGNDLSKMSAVNDAATFGGVSLTEDVKPAVPRMDMIEALDRVKKAGLEKHLTLPNQPDIPPAQLEITIHNAQKRRENEATIERGPQGFIPSALQVGTSFLVGAVDPINVASAFIPVMGELRYGKLLASAGDNIGERLALRAGVGAAQGAVGQAALEPLDWWAHTQEGRDFGMADVLHNIMFGAALGGGLHAGGGFISDAYRNAKGRALYPFGPGEVLDRTAGTHVPAALLHEDGVSADDLHDHLGEMMQKPETPATNAEIEQLIAHVEQQLAPPSPAVQVINDLPPRAHEDAMRGAIANLIEGEPVRSGEMLEAAAKTDPRIAESFEAFHGSPHDFERFDNSKIGTGEGAQVFAYGHYLAEEKAVAEEYQRKLSADKNIKIGEQALQNPGLNAGAVRQAYYTLKSAEGDIDRAIARAAGATNAEELQAILREWKQQGVTTDPGVLYRVRIKPERERFLQWETDLTDQPAGRMVLEKMDPTLKEHLEEELDRHDQPALDQLTGGMLHRLLERFASEGELPGVKGDGGHPKREASEYLASLDVPGVMFLDQKSRKRGALGNLDAKPVDDAATRNFVVFNDKDIEITHKNGEPVKREEIVRTQHVAPKAPRGRAAADPQTWSLYEFLAHEGGLKPDQELNAIFGNAKGPFVPGFGALVRPSGRTLDDALRLAKDHGYLFDAADVTGAEGHLVPRDLLDKLAEENSGRKQYRNDHQHATKAEDAAAIEHEKHQILTLLHDEIEASTGQKGVKVDPALEDRVVQIVMKEGEHDVLAAYERAIMEDAERYETLSHERRNGAETAHLPGWDADVAGAASGDGRANPVERGQAGRADQGAGRADGGQPRSAGAGDRGEVPAQLDKAAAWRSLAAKTPDFNDPDIIAKSNAAAKVEPPSTKLDERVSAAEKADAYAQSMYEMFAHRLPEDERIRLQEYLAELDRNKADKDFVSQRGAACLFEGGL